MANQQIAKTSKTPGRTQTVNFYDFNKYRLVDLPGYGFMKGSHELKNQVATIIETYLASRANLYGIFQICDANVITAADVDMSKYLQKHFKNHFVVLNKIDKRSVSVYQNKLLSTAKYLNVSPLKIIFISVKKHLNINKVHETINDILKRIQK